MSKEKIEKLEGLVLITGASSGIGLELARCAAADGCTLLLVADTDLGEAEAAARAAGAAAIETLQADLSTPQGIDAVMTQVGNRTVDVLMANAAVGTGGAFLDQQWDAIANTIETNITGTVSLVHRIGKAMVARDHGRILVTGSIVADMPGPFNLIYNSTKAFVVDFCVGLAEELKDSKVVITCLLPGATDTPFFERAGMEDAPVAQSKKADPATVAKDGYQALLDGDTKEVSGLMNKIQYFFADILPDEVVAKMHRKMAEPRHGG